MIKGFSQIKNAIICFQYVERIKSELIITSKLLWELPQLKGDELVGGKKIMSSIFDALLGEIRLAQNLLKLKDFEAAGSRISRAAEQLRQDDYVGATQEISRAISNITTSGQKAMQDLKDKGFL